MRWGRARIGVHHTIPDVLHEQHDFGQHGAHASPLAGIVVAPGHERLQRAWDRVLSPAVRIRVVQKPLGVDHEREQVVDERFLLRREMIENGVVARAPAERRGHVLGVGVVVLERLLLL
jgi:hypothetical protein